MSRGAVRTFSSSPDGKGVDVDYRAIFDAVPGLYLILDRDLSIVAANDAYCRATMTDVAGILGRPLFQVFPDNPDDPNADGVRNLHASLDRVLKFGRPDVMAVQKYDIRTPDGAFEARYWSPLNTPIHGPDGGVRLIVHRVEDVTELVRLRQEEQAHDRIMQDQTRTITELRRTNLALDEALKTNAQLRRDRLHLADILEHSRDAIIGRTLDGIVTAWNRGAEATFGYRAEEMLGRSISILVPLALRADAQAVMQRILDKEPLVRYETVRLHKNGNELQVSATVSPVINEAGEIVGTSAFMRDITEQKLAEERLKNLQAELIHLSRWNMMGMMASTIAHELNQPLTASVNYVRAARRILDGTAPDMPKATSFLDRAVDETKLAGGVIRSLREFIDKRETHREEENLNSVVQEALTLSQAGAPNQSAEVRLELESVLPAVVINKIQIEQVLLNLIRNALDAMAGAPSSRLAISTSIDQPGFVAVHVHDNGPGIPPEIQAKLFQPFVTSKEQGMGVGLTICQSIVEAHDGTIRVETGSDGTIFHVRLPVAK